MTRALTTLAAAVGAGALIWASSRFFEDGELSIGEYWGIMGLLAAAGLVLALSQLLGGWTKGGGPIFSPTVFLLGFVPALVAGGFIVWFFQQPPEDGWLVDDVQAFAEDIRIDGLVVDLQTFLVLFPVLIGLLLGFCFDTAAREESVVERREREDAAEQPTAVSRPPAER